MEIAAVVLIIVNILIAVILAIGTAPIMVWWERRIAGFIQDRPGPNRSDIGGFRLGGLIQSFADMFKLVFKEDFTPSFIKYRFFYTIAPGIVFFASFLTFAVIPFADNLVIDGFSYQMQAIPMHLGILWFLAYAGLSVYGIILGGYSSESKYGLLGAIRASAQVISYEAAMGLALVSLLITYGSVDLNTAVHIQGGLLLGFIPSWGVIMQPLACLIFVVTAFAETNRTPFDIAEGESEIVAGYHVEYSAMKFGLFQVGEYAAMCASSALIVTLFFGGYQIPWVDTATLQAHMNTILIILIILCPLGILGFTKWIKKNNVWKNPNDRRAKETKFLVKALWATAIIMVVIFLALLIIGLTTNGVNIMTGIIQVCVFLVKFFLMCFVFIWIRWTLLRFRYDQLQMLGWKVLLPLALLNIVITAVVVVLGN